MVPRLVRDEGADATRRFLEFFTAAIRNRNTRTAYARATAQFFAWCDEQELRITELNPILIAAYVEELGQRASRPTVKQHLAALRMLFDYFVLGHIIATNPATSVRGPKHVVRKGKTPVLSAEDTRALLDSIDISSVAGLRDRALIGCMVYSFARVSAVVGMDVDDYYQNGKRWWLRLQEKGGKQHEVPAHHNAEAYLDAYVAAAGLVEQKGTPLFRSLHRRRAISGRRIHRNEVLQMVKRRARAAGLPSNICCHSFRATGITTYLKNGGTLEKAQAIAAHESSRTTQLYNRTADDISLDEIERVVI